MIRFIFALMAASLLLAAGPSRAAPPLEVYGKLPAMQMVTLSPSGQRYAFIAESGQGRKLFIATTDNKPLIAIPVGDSKIVSLRWAGDKYVLVYTTTTVSLNADMGGDKADFGKGVIVNVDARKISSAFHDVQYVDEAAHGYFGTAQINGRWYGYYNGLTKESLGSNDGRWRYKNTTDDFILPDLYRVDLDTGDLTFVAKGEVDIDDWLVDTKGEIVARLIYNQTTGDWRVKSGKFGGRELASGREKFGRVEILGLGKTADSILIQYQGDKGRITKEAPLDGAPAKLVSDELSPDYPIYDQQTRQWLGTITDGDQPSYALFSPAFDARVRAARKAFPGYRVVLKSWSSDFNRMIVETDGGDDSGTYWLVDIAKQSADPLGGAYPLVGPKDVGPVKMIDYKAADGLPLRGVLTLPPGRAAKKLPLVVMPHGGPEGRDYPDFDWWAQAFASRGYAVFQPNFRGSSGYGSKFVEAGYAQWGRKMQTDISDGVAELARQGIVDPKRACIVGASYGGYAALAGVTVQQGLYRCAVSLGGVTDLARINIGGFNAGGRYWSKMLGVDTQGWDSLHAISPVKLADRADASILLIHGTRDTWAPIEQSDIMEQYLKHFGKPVERVTLKDADQYLLSEKDRAAVLKASVDFVLKYNPPDLEAAPAVH